MNTVITVTQLNTYIKSIIEDDRILNRIFVIGEISNLYQDRRSGHIYMTLKDERSQIKAVMFRNNSLRLSFSLENGMRIICIGRVSIYDRDSTYQLYVDSIQPDGIGSLAIAFEQLKDKLEQEGLFDEKHKKQIPIFSKKIGVATSSTGAAVEDIKNITKRRFPYSELVIAPTIVQGDMAPEDIAKSIELLDSIDDIDVIIVGRGGGSIEDLWAFNTELVARAVFNCSKPIISAVGHETDFTICDFVADFRAETPSAAAEKVTPDINSVMTYIDTLKDRMCSAVTNTIQYNFQRLDSICKDSILLNNSFYFERKYDVINNYIAEISNAFNNVIESKKYSLGTVAGKLDALSPLSVLSRGYCYATDLKNNQINKSNQIVSGEKIKLRLSDATAICTVDEVNINGNDI